MSTAKATDIAKEMLRGRHFSGLNSFNFIIFSLCHLAPHRSFDPVWSRGGVGGGGIRHSFATWLLLLVGKSDKGAADETKRCRCGGRGREEEGGGGGPRQQQPDFSILIHSAPLCRTQKFAFYSSGTRLLRPSSHICYPSIHSHLTNEGVLTKQAECMANVSGPGCQFNGIFAASKVAPMSAENRPKVPFERMHP